MKNQKLWNERLNELQSFINTHKQLPKSNGGKLYRFINENQKIDPIKNQDKYIIWITFMKNNYHLFDHTENSLYQLNCENLWCYLKEECSLFKKRPDKTDGAVYYWFDYHVNNMNSKLENSGKTWYPIRDKKYRKKFIDFYSQNPQFEF
jgi:hypothetical protein